MAHATRQPTPIVPALFRGDTQLTRRWTHGVFSGESPPIAANVVGTIYDETAVAFAHSGLAGVSSVIRPGTLTIIPEGWRAHWEVQRPMEVSHVYVTRRRLQQCANAMTKGRHLELQVRLGYEDPVACGVLALLSHEAQRYDPSASLFVEQGIDLLCTHLVRKHSSMGEVSALRVRGLAAWQVKRVVGYMNDCIDQELSLDELAAQVHLSRFYFCTAFRHATGQSPHQWLTRRRMQRAGELLSQTRDSIMQVALAVGYKTPSAFTAAFRKEIGTTPSEFRRRR